MDKDITQMFLTKNKEILEKSLMFEIDRNLDALKQTTDNCIILEVNKVYNFLKKFFEEIEFKYDEKKLKELIKNIRNKINSTVNEKIEEKKKNLEEYIKEKKKQEIVPEESITNYYNLIDSTTEETNTYLEKVIKEEICTEMTPSLFKNFKLKEEEHQERIRSRVDGLLSDVIVRRMKEEILFRDNVLKNMCEESYKRYLQLNKQTAESSF